MNEPSHDERAHISIAKGGGPERQRLDGALIDAERAVRALRDRGEDAAALAGRAEALLQSAQSAAQSKASLLAWDCLYQIERERVVELDDEARRAVAIAYEAESEALEPWQHFAARALRRDDSVSTANVQALMRIVHEARLDRRFNAQRARAQVTAMALLLAAAAIFVGIWALVGGLDWVLQSVAEVTVAMLLVNGMIFGFLGALLSSALTAGGRRPTDRTRDRRRSRAATLARPFVGAVIAVPIVFVLQSGLINMGEASPIIDLLACFAGGFLLDRTFAAQF